MKAEKKTHMKVVLRSHHSIVFLSNDGRVNAESMEKQQQFHNTLSLGMNSKTIFI